MEDNKINLTKENDNAPQGDIKQEIHVEPIIPEQVQPAADPMPAQVPPQSNEETKASKNKKIGTIAIIAVAAAIVIGVGAGVSANAYKEPIKNYYAAIEQGSGKKMQKAFGKPIVSAIDDMLKDEDFYDDGDCDDIDDFFDQLAETYKDEIEDEYGKKVKVKYDITSKKKLDKDDLKDYKDDLKDSFDKKLKVTKGYKVKTKVTCKGKDDKETKKLEMIVLKVNGKWMAMNESDLMTMAFSMF